MSVYCLLVFAASVKNKRSYPVSQYTADREATGSSSMDVQRRPLPSELPDTCNPSSPSPSRTNGKAVPSFKPAFSGEGQILKNQRPMVFALDNYVTGWLGEMACTYLGTEGK